MTLRRDRPLALLQSAFVMLTVVIDPLPEVSQRLRIVPDVTAVEFGERFTLEVERRFTESLRPQPWDDAALAPLVVRETDRASRVDDGVVVETIRFDAYAFERDVVRIEKPRWGAQDGDGEVIPALGHGLELRVTSSLPADDAGVPELPGEPFPEPTSHARWWVMLGGGLALVFALLVRAHGRSRGDTRAAGERSRVDVWLGNAAAVDATVPSAAIAAWARLARECLEVEGGIPALERTTEELTGDGLITKATVEVGSAELGRLLRLADRVKFAEHGATRAEAEDASAALRTFFASWFAARELRA